MCMFLRGLRRNRGWGSCISKTNISSKSLGHYPSFVCRDASSAFGVVLRGSLKYTIALPITKNMKIPANHDLVCLEHQIPVNHDLVCLEHDVAGGKQEPPPFHCRVATFGTDGEKEVLCMSRLLHPTSVIGHGLGYCRSQ